MTVKIKPLSVTLPRGDHLLARGLAGAWLFNEGRKNTLWDVSGRGHPGTLTGMDPATDWVGGPHGYALDFDGTDDRVIVGPEAGINLGTANACIVRYKHLAVGNDVLVGHKSQSDGGYFLAFGSGNINYAASGSYVGVSHGISAGDEVWLGVSRQGTSVTFYKNGVQLAIAQTLGANNDLRISTIGSYWSGASTYSANMRCDYVYCWDRALSAGEMAWLYREPFCLFRRSSVLAALGVGGQVHNLSGLAQALSSASGAATVLPTAWQPTGTAWPRVTLSIEASWRKEALLHGMTDVGVRLGTVLTQGWFWTRRAGCSAVYRLEECEVKNLKFEDSPRRTPQLQTSHFPLPTSLVAVVPLNVKQIVLPTYLPHEAGSSCCYLLRRFNSCGQQDHTMGAGICVRTDSAGCLAPPAPNTMLSMKARQIAGNRVECTWFYCPVDQETAPHAFNVYWNRGAGDVDFVNPIAVLPYEGRKFYRYQSGPLQEGKYVFAVRAESVTKMESQSQGIAVCEIRAVTPGEPGILDVEAI